MHLCSRVTAFGWSRVLWVQQRESSRVVFESRQPCSPANWPHFSRDGPCSHSNKIYVAYVYTEKGRPGVVKKPGSRSCVTGFDHCGWRCQEIWDRCFQTCRMPKTFPGVGLQRWLHKWRNRESMRGEDTSVYSPRGAWPTSLHYICLSGLALSSVVPSVLLFVCPWIKCSIVVSNPTPVTRLQMWFWSASQSSVC